MQELKQGLERLQAALDSRLDDLTVMARVLMRHNLIDEFSAGLTAGRPSYNFERGKVSQEREIRDMLNACEVEFAVGMKVLIKHNLSSRYYLERGADLLSDVTVSQLSSVTLPAVPGNN